MSPPHNHKFNMAAPMDKIETTDLTEQISVCLTSGVASECGRAIDCISKRLIDGNFQLIQFVEGLGPYLAHEDKDRRKDGTNLLATVLHRIPPSFLNLKEVDLLAKFFNSRTKDHHSVLPAVLSGLNALSTFTSLSDDDAIGIVRTVFQDVQMQTLVQADRRSVLRMIFNFLHSKLEGMKSLGADFVFGYIQMMDGEKDPRNLIIAFDTVLKIINNFNIEPLAEELFEVTGCYFPIDFNPPPGDKLGVQRQELVAGLNACLSATPLFASFCLPLLLEKLNSDLDSSKLAAMLLLAGVVEIYGGANLEEFQISLWASLSREVFMSVNVELEQAALTAIAAMVRALHKNTTVESRRNLEEFCKIAIKDCKRHLFEPDMKLMLCSGRLLRTMAASCHVAARLIYTETIPHLLELFHKTSLVSSRVQVLDVLIGFAQAARSYLSSGDGHPLYEFTDDLCVLFLSLTADGSHLLRCKGLRGSVAVIDFTNDRQVTIVSACLQLAVTDVNELVRKEANTSLAAISRSHSRHIISALPAKLFDYLDDEAVCVESEEVDISVRQQTCTLSSLIATLLVASVDNVDVATVTLPKAVNRLQKEFMVLNQSNISTILEHMVTLVELSLDNMAIVHLTFCHVVQPLIDTLIVTSYRCGGCDVITSVQTILSKLVLTTMYKLEPSFSQDYVGSVVGSFTGSRSAIFSLSSRDQFLPLQPTSSPAQTRLIFILRCLVSSLPRKYVVPEQETLLSIMEDLCLCSCDDVTRTEACKLLSQIINKMETDSSSDDYIASLTSRLQTKMADSHVFTLWAWLSKGLILRAHPVYKVCLDEIIRALDSDLGAQAAQAFQVILSDCDDVMNKLTHANVRLLYKQRLFVEALPRLVSGFGAAAEGKKSHYLMSLSHLLTYVPKQVVLSELPPLLPLLMQSLTSECPDIWLSTLGTINNLLLDAPVLMTSYTDSLLQHCLRLSAYEGDMKVRVGALSCLSTICRLPTHVLLPHQKVVLKQLQLALDDKKRLVRREAVQARCNWYLVGGATN